MPRLAHFTSALILALGLSLCLDARAQQAAPADAQPVPAAAPADAQPAAPAPAPAPAKPAAGAAIDRGVLLAPAAPAPAPEPRAGERKVESGIGASPTEVFAEDWWTHARPVLELHGYYRVRAELFHGFALGRTDAPNVALWPQPIDNSYIDASGGAHGVPLCDVSGATSCTDKSQAGANMRFRIGPTLHVSDNVRILSQIDMLDNVVLGSTPNGWRTASTSTDPYTPVGGTSSTQVSPRTGVNSWQDAIGVKRAWGEYATPIGELRFGRMPDQWGLGMLYNAGDGYDSDWQSTTDRIMFVTGLKSLDLYLAGAWGFPDEGATSASQGYFGGGQPYDLAQLDDASEYIGMLVRRRSPELQKLDLAHGDVVLNGGLRFTYRDQLLSSDAVASTAGGAAQTSATTQLLRRGLTLYVSDAWLQLLYRKLRFEIEGALIAGHIDNTSSVAGSRVAVNPLDPTDLGYGIRQWGTTSQLEYRAVEDKLKLQMGFGWASGDSGLLPNGARTSTLSPSDADNGSVFGRRAQGSRTYTEFRFHPDYRVDLILFRNVLSRVQGSYYFRPSIDYDFTRTTQGQRLGGGAAVIWSRASEFVQTPGHKRDLGLEIDLSLYYQSKDGSLNDVPDKAGGFYTMLQYGVLFPLGGLGYMPREKEMNDTLDTSTAHTLRWYMGILY